MISYGFDLLQRIMSVQYKIPDYVHISQDCRHLLSRVFVASPSRVCTAVIELVQDMENACSPVISVPELVVIGMIGVLI